MPLKPDDLKTVETYKKAIKQDVTRITAEGKTKFWVFKDIELPSANGSKQKLPALISLVDDVAVKVVLKGKQPLCRGTVGLEGGGKITFAADQGKVPYARLTKAVPLLLGKMVHVPPGADVDNDEPEGASAAPPPPQAPPPPPSAPPGASGKYAQLNAAFKDLVDEAKTRIAAHPNEKDRLGGVLNDIRTMLSGGQLAEAEKRIQQLQGALKAAPAAAAATAPASRPPSDAPAGGIVKYRRALVEFAQAKSKVQGQIGALKSAIVKLMPDETDFANDLAAELEELNQELADAVDEAMKASENEASPANDAVRMKIRKYVTELSSNDLIEKADGNPLGVQVTIAATLGEALGRIRDAMPAPH